MLQTILYATETVGLDEPLRLEARRKAGPVALIECGPSGIVERAVRDHPCLIVLGSSDYSLHALSELKTRRQTKEIPVVVLGDEDAGDEIKELASELGADGFVANIPSHDVWSELLEFLKK